jgi:alkylation response protein AidB-like acyl-CoA dehydrogenase
VEIGPTADQLNLRDTVREVLAVECPPSLARHAYTDPQAWQHLWKLVVGLGWTSLARRGFDGEDLGLTSLDLVLALEACGSVLAPIPLLSSVGLAAGALRAAGDAMGDVLSEIADGTPATLAAQRGHRRLPGAPMALRNGRIQGTAVAVPDAQHAELIVVLCTVGDAVSVAVVRPGDGVALIPAESADPSRPLATVNIDARPERMVPMNTGSALSAAWLAVAAELVGVAQGALDLAVAHARSRRQFDRPIGSYQGIKHALADNLVAVERARSLSYLAAARLDDTTAPDHAAGICALAKAAAGDAALHCARTAVQVFGAIGQTWEHEAHLFLRRAWLGASQLGDSSSLYAAEGQRFLSGVSR